ncbi:MAG: ATP-binding protein, partial [Actinomycetia bacterium]|nr:ATP-binding protein [Actinomycetes bacterium]
MLIGRQRQAETLSEALDSARAGRSAVVCIHGQPGGGKTELLRSAIEDADGMRVLRADGHVAESDLPYAGLHQLIAPLKTQIEQIPVIQQTALRQVLGEYDGEPPDRMAVATAVLSLVTTLTESGPVLIAVDDFGWLDASTQKLLIFVCRRLDADAVVVVLSARSVHAALVRGLGT